ncbi:hypothetical protein CXF95_01270 [Paraglaciecola sp. MB-3u-78]|nr:hypothetical protein CXF95_01270 [Paraglaciecola sp. MB-3u-78]
MHHLLGLPEAEILALLDAGHLQGYKALASDNAYFHPDAPSKFMESMSAQISQNKINLSKNTRLAIASNSSEYELVKPKTIKSGADLHTLPSNVEPSPVVDLPAVAMPSLNEVSERKKDLLTVDYLCHYNDGTKAISGYPGLYLRRNKKSLVVIFRIKASGQRLDLMNFNNDILIEESDVKTIKKAYERFRVCLAGGRPWNNKSYLLDGQKRKIRTFNELLKFYSEDQRIATQSKIKRYQKRYFSGALGERLLSTYCHEQFAKDYLDISNPQRMPSDRNEIVKIIKAACSLAKGSPNIEIDVQELVNKSDRSYADEADKTMPSAEIYDMFLGQAYDRNDHNLCMSLILQFFVSTRKSATNHMRWQQVNLEDNIVEVPSHLNKNGRLARLAFPSSLSRLLRSFKANLASDLKKSKTKSGDAIYVFESPKIKGQAVSNFDKEFNAVKSKLLSDHAAFNLDSTDSKEIRQKTKKFTQHRLRDVMDMQLLEVGASNAQKEKAAGRRPGENARAYEDLSIEKMINLKDRVFDKMLDELPNFKRVVEGLENHYKD